MPFNVSNTMSLIKTWLLEEQRRQFEAGQAEYKDFMTNYTQDQQFILNDIADEQERIMRELMSEEVAGDADYHQG
jgi:predicted DNA-binding ArsR family transcriptional regulator